MGQERIRFMPIFYFGAEMRARPQARSHPQANFYITLPFLKFSLKDIRNKAPKKTSKDIYISKIQASSS